MRIRKSHAVTLGAVCFGGLGLCGGCVVTLPGVPYAMRLEYALLGPLVVGAALAAFGAIVGLAAAGEGDPPSREGD